MGVARFLCGCVVLLLFGSTPGWGTAPRTYDLPAGEASRTLRLFAETSDRELLFAAQVVRGVTSNAVRGDYTALEAIERMLAGTTLQAVPDEVSGAIAVRPIPRAAVPTSPSSVTDAAQSQRGRNRSQTSNDPDHMKARNPIALFASLLAFATSPGAAQDGSATSTGIVEGGVPNAESGEDSTVRLSAFEVNTSRDFGYQSTSTVSGTRTNELLRDMPMAVTVLNRQFIDDIAATDPAGVFNFGLNIESGNVSGIGNDYGGGGNSVVIRGVQSPWNSRDGFIWYAISDNFNTETIEILRGPSGNIYGDGRVGGVLNIATKRAKLRDFGSVVARWDSENSWRGTLDYNRRIGEKAGLRVNALGSDQRYWKDTAYDRRAGLALAFTYDFTPRTRFSGNIEKNWVRRVNTRGLLTDNFSSGYVLGSGSLGATAPTGTATIQGAAGNTQRWTLVGDQLVNLKSTPTTLFRHTAGIPANAQTNVDQSIIPRHQQWHGPSDQLNHDSLAVNAALEHQFGDNTTVELAFNLQLSDRTDIASNLDGVRRDVNPQIPDGRGGLIPNPGFDKLYVDHRYTSTQYWNSVPSYRLTVLHDFDFGFTKQRLITGLSLRDERFRLTQRREMLREPDKEQAGRSKPDGVMPLHVTNSSSRGVIDCTMECCAGVFS